MSFELHNETVLRGYLAHLQSNVRAMAGLDFARANHPDSKGPSSESPVRKLMRTMWDDMARDLVKVLGTEAELKPFNELASLGGSFSRTEMFNGRDPFRITFRVLKARADKARMKDPTITLLKGWDLKAKERKHEA